MSSWAFHDAVKASTRKMLGRDIPSAAELAIPADLRNALACRVSERTGHKALFSTRDKAARIAVMALDAATDEWLAGYEARCREEADSAAKR